MKTKKIVLDWILTLGIAFLWILAFEFYARDQFERDKVETGYYRSWEMEWKVRQYEDWRKGINEESLDIVFLGNSKMVSGVDPKIFDQVASPLFGKRVRSFNFGADGISLNGILKTVLPQLLCKKPDLVIFELSPVVFWNRDAKELPYLKAPVARTWSLEAFLLKYSWFFAARKALRPGWKPKEPPKWVSEQGFKGLPLQPENREQQGVERFFEHGLKAGANVASKKETQYFNSKTFWDLGQIIRILEKHEIDLRFVFMPEVFYPYDLNKQERVLFFEKMQVYEDRGFPLLKLQDLPEVLKKGNFIDAYHMSHQGAALFSRILAESLRIDP